MQWSKYRDFVMSLAAPCEHKDRLIVGAMGLAGEAGEVIDYLKKVRFHGHAMDDRKLLLELGDVFWYLTHLTSTLGFTLDEVMEANVEKLTKRYGEKFSTAKSVNRVDEGVTKSFVVGQDSPKHWAKTE